MSKSKWEGIRGVRGSARFLGEGKRAHAKAPRARGNQKFFDSAPLVKGSLGFRVLRGFLEAVPQFEVFVLDVRVEFFDEISG